MATAKVYAPDFQSAASKFMGENGPEAESVAGGGDPPDNSLMEARLAALEQAIKDLPSKVDFAELRADMSEGREGVHKLLLENSRWTHTALVGMLSVSVIGIIGLLLTIWNATKSSPPATAPAPAPIIQPAAQAPIIISVPAAPSSPKK